MARRTVRVALVGIGNCASSLVQGVARYTDAASDVTASEVPGLMHPVLGGYAVGDIEFVAAFDVAASKVGRDLGQAILAAPNDTIRLADVAQLGVEVRRGPTLDGLGPHLARLVPEAPDAVDDVTASLRRSGAEVVVAYLPVGSTAAVHFYAECALEAGCAFINCIPVFIASDAGWRARFEARGLPLVGDDIKSQVGATIVHRALTRLFADRGVRLDRTYQLNFGGNADFLNMLDRDRLQSKKLSKTQAVTSEMPALPAPETVHVGPSDHVPWLGDRKWCHIRMEGTGFGEVPLVIDLKLEVWDSPNSAGVVIDAVRCAKLALDRGIGGALGGPSAYFMKSPPRQFADHEALALTEAFIRGEAR